MKEKNVINYFVLCNKLKNVIRTGWLDWNIKRERVESVAEHIYSVSMLAIAMYSEYEYDIDLHKVITMIAVHELEEIIIGDIPVTSINHKNKKEIGHQAVEEILSPLLKAEEIKSLIFEFDEKNTKEALFAYHCDKLECDLQARIYDEEACIDLSNQPENSEYHSESVQNRVNSGLNTFTDLWFAVDAHYYNDDKNFMEVFNYAKSHEITKKDQE